MKPGNLFHVFTGCDVGEVRLEALRGSAHETAAESLVGRGLLNRHPVGGTRVGYSLTEDGKRKADDRARRIG